VTDGLPPEFERIMERGAFCSIAAETTRGPHLTPLVFAWSDGRVWLTTSRGSVKARAWRADPRVAGLVQDETRAVTFTGRAAAYDVVDPSTWVRTAVRMPAVTAASARFTAKNARFFAGYAVDARRVPLAWTPPGRVFVEIVLERAALLDAGEVRARWGAWDASLGTGETFRARRRGTGAFAALPPTVRSGLGGSGPAALGIAGREGTVVLPARWVEGGPDVYAAMPRETLAIAGASEGPVPVALSVDRASWWRAREMIGAMAQGMGQAFLPDRLRAGGGSAEEMVRRTGSDFRDAALVRIRPERLVWWSGWSSGSVTIG
jgi:Pyridoxamine 5'-phosphate oxidase